MELTFPQPSDQGVVVLSEILQDNQSSAPSTKVALVSLFSIALAFQSNCLSGDLRFLSMAAAKKMAMARGVKEDDFDEIAALLMSNRGRHPMDGMF